MLVPFRTVSFPYKEDEDLKSWFKGCVTLALVPPEKVGGVFVDIIMEEAPVQKYPHLIRFMDYMTMNVDLVRDLAITTPKNVYLQSDSIDTLNDLKYYLNTVKQLVQQF